MEIICIKKIKFIMIKKFKLMMMIEVMAIKKIKPMMTERMKVMMISGEGWDRDVPLATRRLGHDHFWKRGAGCLLILVPMTRDMMVTMTMTTILIIMKMTMVKNDFESRL